MNSGRARVVNLDGTPIDDFQSLESFGGGGHDGGMSELAARVERLEKDVAEVKSILGRMEPVLGRIQSDFGEFKGRSAAMPTTWQLITLVLAIIGVVAVFQNMTLSRIDRVETKIEALGVQLPPKLP
jgi:hypothetical protein